MHNAKCIMHNYMFLFVGAAIGSPFVIQTNPVIPIDESVVLGKRFLTDFFPFRDEIHAEKYICIDTETDNYTIFDDEKSIEEYAASLGISQNWTKIKFDEKVNN